MDKYIAWDTEIYKEMEGENPNVADYLPVGITCSGVYDSVTGEKFAFYPEAGDYDGFVMTQMSVKECQEMTAYLADKVEQGYKIVTWNGAFDFRVLLWEVHDPNYQELVKTLALGCIDPMFTLVCTRGFPKALDDIAKALGVEGKLEGMHGDLAPVMWRKGRESQDKVIEYVIQDAVATWNVFEALADKGYVEWLSKSGKSTVSFTYPGPLTVVESLRIPYDFLYGSSPLTPREGFYHWALPIEITEFLLNEGDVTSDYFVNLLRGFGLWSL